MAVGSALAFAQCALALSATGCGAKNLTDPGGGAREPRVLVVGGATFIYD